MQQTPIMRWCLAIGMAMSVSVCWSLSYAGTNSDGRAVIGPATSNTMTSSAPPATEATVGPMPLTVPVESGLVLRTIPNVSKLISVGGTTLVPYIGAWFGGGYATELDRSLNAPQSAFAGSFNAGQKNLFGQQLSQMKSRWGSVSPSSLSPSSAAHSSTVSHRVGG